MLNCHDSKYLLISLFHFNLNFFVEDIVPQVFYFILFFFLYFILFCSVLFFHFSFIKLVMLNLI